MYFHALDLGVDVIAWFEHPVKDIHVHISIKNLRDVQTAIAPVMHAECVNVLSINFAKNSRADSVTFFKVGSFGGNDEQRIIPRDDMKLLNLRF